LQDIREAVKERGKFFIWAIAAFWLNRESVRKKSRVTTVTW